MTPYLSIVSPIFSCRDCLEQLVDETAVACQEVTDSFEVILVDDGSPDGAWQTIVELTKERAWLRGIRLSRNFGQHQAISAGIARSRGSWTVVMDCDLQDPPAAIPELHRVALTKGCDVVFAQRSDRQDRAAKRFSSWFFYRMLTWLTGVRQDASTANFGIYRRTVIDAIVAMPEQDRAFPLMVKWAGFPTEYLPVQHAERATGQSSYTLGKMMRLATHVILGYSDKPLRMVATGGVICSLIALVMVVMALFTFLTGETTVAGFTSIMASIWLLGGAILFSLGIVGLYVGQVFRNVQGRPLSITAQEIIGGSEGVRGNDSRESDVVPGLGAPSD